MTLGETTYRSMKESGEWGRKTREEEQLIALQARCDTLEAQVAAAKHKPRSSNQDNIGRAPALEERSTTSCFGSKCLPFMDAKSG